MKKPIFLLVLFSVISIAGKTQQIIFVSPNGDNSAMGNFSHPLKMPDAAIRKAASFQQQKVIILFREGSYHLDKNIEINAAMGQWESLTIQPYLKEKVTFTGSAIIKPEWKPYKNKILKAHLDLSNAPDQLFLDGKSLPMARFPDFDSSARVYNGTDSNAISDERVKSWHNPAGGYIHALHNGEWGDFHFLITGKDASGKLLYEGGWQNNRPSPMNKIYRFVENIFEELDAPGEWFFDAANKIIYLYPPKGYQPGKSELAISTLTDLFHIKGDINKPAKNVTIKNITFTQTARSFMLTKEPLLRSDWTIYRGGAILLEGTENVSIANCTFYELGGNAIFLSKYNKSNVIKDNLIHHIGGSAISFVGNPDAVRSPSFRYENFVPWEQMDYTPGPKSKDFPQYCKASGNLVYSIGTIEKQVAGVEISMSSNIEVSHNSIYKVPRAGINIGDGCWGGHVIQNNDVFKTVLETGDHGAFNSWGRDRFWRPERPIIDSIVAARPGIELLDVIQPIVIRNNRFQCDHGWDIDLDDGSSNYQIYNNICLSGGLKLREGYRREVFNNIIINNTFHPHVWLKNSGDRFVHNIVTLPYAPILMDNWGAVIDSNFFLTPEGLSQAQQLGLDAHSLAGDAQFINAAKGDYRLRQNSSAFKIGFHPFSMNVGVTDVGLKRIAGTPVINPLITHLDKEKGKNAEFLGAQVKNIETLGERSAAGLPDMHGVLITDLSENSMAYKNGIRKGDVILKMGHQAINSVSDLLKEFQNIKWQGSTKMVIMRNQEQKEMNTIFKLK